MINQKKRIEEEKDLAVDEEEEDNISFGGKEELTRETVEVRRNAKDRYRSLEKWFGVLKSGMGFGETGFLLLEEDHPKFYTSIACCDTTVLQLKKSSFLNVLKDF